MFIRAVIYFLVLFLLCRHYVVKGPEETPYFGETETKLATLSVCESLMIFRSCVVSTLVWS